MSLASSSSSKKISIKQTNKETKKEKKSTIKQKTSSSSSMSSSTSSTSSNNVDKYNEYNEDNDNNNNNNNDILDKDLDLLEIEEAIFNSSRDESFASNVHIQLNGSKSQLINIQEQLHLDELMAKSLAESFDDTIDGTIDNTVLEQLKNDELYARQLLSEEESQNRNINNNHVTRNNTGNTGSNDTIDEATQRLIDKLMSEDALGNNEALHNNYDADSNASIIFEQDREYAESLRIDSQKTENNINNDNDNDNEISDDSEESDKDNNSDDSEDSDEEENDKKSNIDNNNEIPKELTALERAELVRNARLKRFM